MFLARTDLTLYQGFFIAFHEYICFFSFVKKCIPFGLIITILLWEIFKMSLKGYYKWQSSLLSISHFSVEVYHCIKNVSQFESSYLLDHI